MEASGINSHQFLSWNVNVQAQSTIKRERKLVLIFNPDVVGLLRVTE